MAEHVNGVHRGEHQPRITAAEVVESAGGREVARERGPAAPREPRLLDELLGDGLDLRPIAERHGMTLRQLVKWSQRPEVARTLAGMRRLSDQRAATVVARHRVGAAHQLWELAQGVKLVGSAETARKACVDLLKLGGGMAETTTPARDAAEPALDDRVIADLHSLMQTAGGDDEHVEGEPGGGT